MTQRQRPTKRARQPSQERSIATVEAILEAAARILEREGMTARFGTNRIAREAGVSIGSLYEYFTGRDAIVQRLGERHFGEVRALMDNAFELFRDAPVDVAVDRVIDGLFRLHAARPSLQRTLQNVYPGQFGLQPFIDTDQYVAGKLVEWLLTRFEGVDPVLAQARAFVATRAVRTVTIHASAEGLSEEHLCAVRATLKVMLVQLLDLQSPYTPIAATDTLAQVSSAHVR